MTSHVLRITTAYEQGVGKGHQAHHRATEIANPYSDSECSEAWALGYKEGKAQAERLKQVEPVAWMFCSGVESIAAFSTNRAAVLAHKPEAVPLYTHQQHAEPVAWQTVYQAVTKAIEQCKSASGMHTRIGQLVNPTQITHDALGTDTAST